MKHYSSICSARRGLDSFLVISIDYGRLPASEASLELGLAT